MCFSIACSQIIMNQDTWFTTRLFFSFSLLLNRSVQYKVNLLLISYVHMHPSVCCSHFMKLGHVFQIRLVKKFILQVFLRLCNSFQKRTFHKKIKVSWNII